MEDLFEQIRDRYNKQEKALQNCRAERDKLSEENLTLREKLVKREDELWEVKGTVDGLKDELKDKEEMLKRVETDYSTNLAMLVDVTDERDKLKGELEMEKRSIVGLREKLEKYGEVLEKVETLCKERNVKEEETNKGNEFEGMEGLEQCWKDAFEVVNLGSGVKTVRIVKKIPVANLTDAVVVDLTQEDIKGGNGLLNLNQPEVSNPVLIKRGRGRPPKRKKFPVIPRPKATDSPKSTQSFTNSSSQTII